MNPQESWGILDRNKKQGPRNDIPETGKCNLGGHFSFLASSMLTWVMVRCFLLVRSDIILKQFVSLVFCSSFILLVDIPPLPLTCFTYVVCLVDNQLTFILASPFLTWFVCIFFHEGCDCLLLPSLSDVVPPCHWSFGAWEFWSGVWPPCWNGPVSLPLLLFLMSFWESSSSHISCLSSFAVDSSYLRWTFLSNSWLM